MDYVNLNEFFITKPADETQLNLCFLDSNMATEVETTEPLFDDADVINFVDEMHNEVNVTARHVGENVVTEPLYSDVLSLDNLSSGDFTTLAPAAVSPQWVCPSTPLAPGSVESYTSVVSPSYSAASPSDSNITLRSPVYENLDSVMSGPVDSPNSADDIYSIVVSPTEVFGERKRKRGRRPKSEAGLCEPRPKKARKTKIYEIDQPFEDKEKERKRLNAVNAKKHRDQQKKLKETLEQQLDVVKDERDSLKKEVEMLRKREKELSQQVDDFKKQAFNLVSVLQTAKLS